MFKLHLFKKVDVMAAFNSLSRFDARGFGAVNSALITILSKKPGAEEVRGFWPISLIHGVAKWVAKVISNRLVPLFPVMIGPTRVPSCVGVVSTTTS
jgi:hypothetical protein